MKWSSLPDFQCSCKTTDSTINDVESKLRVKFSNEYRQLIKEYGTISANGHDIVGISDFPSFSVLEVTQEMKSIFDKIQTNLYVVEDLHIDFVVVWQDESGKIYQSIANTPAKYISASLFDYVNDKYDL